MVAIRQKPRRSLWMFGLESDEPTDEQRREHARQLSERLGTVLEPRPIPRAEDLQLRPPRIKPPDSVAEFCSYVYAVNTGSGVMEHLAALGG